MKEVIIDRNLWWRGQGSFGSKLLRAENGKMCCLGMYSLACGLTAKGITNVGNPAQIKEILPAEMAWLLDEADDFMGASEVCYKLMDTNDTRDYLDREADIKDLFAQQGIAVSFIN